MSEGDILYDILHMAMERTRHLSRISATLELTTIFKGETFPKRVIDLGCGRGNWLKVAQELGAEEVVGIEPFGDIAGDIGIPIIKWDLTKPWKPEGEKYDLAICVETAVHLNKRYADTLINTLSATSDLILWSAAVPGQGGVHHINEQPPAYWAKKFKAHGYECYDLRELLWDNMDVEPWYRQNVLIYKRKGTPGFEQYEKYKVATPRHLIHPILFHGLNVEARKQHVVWDFIDNEWIVNYIPKNPDDVPADDEEDTIVIV